MEGQVSIGRGDAIRSRPRNEDASRDEGLKLLKQRLGEVVLDDAILREVARGRPTLPGTFDE